MLLWHMSINNETKVHLAYLYMFFKEQVLQQNQDWGDKVNHGYLKSRWTGYVKWTSKT